MATTTRLDSASLNSSASSRPRSLRAGSRSSEDGVRWASSLPPYRSLIPSFLALQYAESDASSVTAHFNRWTPATGPDLASARTLEAKYVVGCDGANSTVRKLTGIAMVDLGFTSDWLVRSSPFSSFACRAALTDSQIVDIIPVDPKNLPNQMTEHGPHQLCDPMRPTTVVHGGPGRERIE